MILIKNKSKISKNLLNSILEIYENAECYDKKEVLLTLLEEDQNNSYIKEELEELDTCICGGELEIYREYESSEYFGSPAVESISYKKCTDCGSKPN